MPVILLSNATLATLIAILEDIVQIFDSEGYNLPFSKSFCVNMPARVSAATINISSVIVDAFDTTTPKPTPGKI